MDGSNLNSPTGVSTVWIGNNPYLVTASGVIPLTTNLSGLSLTPTSLPHAAPPSGGDFYVVSVHESPTRNSFQPESNDDCDEADSVNVINNNNKSRQLTAGQSVPIISPTSQAYFNLTNSFNSALPPVNQPVNQFFPTTPPSLINTSLSANRSGTPGNQPGNQFFATTPPALTTPTLPSNQPGIPVNHLPAPSKGVGLPGQPYTAALFNGLPVHPQPSVLSEPLSLSPSLTSSSSLPSPSPSTLSGLSDHGNVTNTDGALNCVYKSSDTLPPVSPLPPGTKDDPQTDRLSPAASKPTYPEVPPRYDRPVNKECCVRCENKVYHMEKLGPVKDCLYHKLCFSCVVCAMILNIKNYHVNPNDMDDVNVYCVTHVPSNKSVCVDAASVSIKGALKAPKLDIINHQIRGGPDAMRGSRIDGESVSVRTAMNAPRPPLEGEHTTYHGYTYSMDA